VYVYINKCVYVCVYFGVDEDDYDGTERIILSSCGAGDEFETSDDTVLPQIGLSHNNGQG